MRDGLSARYGVRSCRPHPLFPAVPTTVAVGTAGLVPGRDRGPWLTGGTRYGNPLPRPTAAIRCGNPLPRPTAAIRYGSFANGDRKARAPGVSSRYETLVA